MKDQGALNGAYGLATVGAIIYFIRHSDSLLSGVVGFLKGLLWPAVVMYALLDRLKL
jgi:hypothetical protein